MISMIMDLVAVVYASIFWSVSYMIILNFNCLKFSVLSFAICQCKPYSIFLDNRRSNRRSAEALRVSGLNLY